MSKTSVTISIPTEKIKTIDRLVHLSGFRSRNAWIDIAFNRLLDLWFMGSPKLPAKIIVKRLRSTKKYSDEFLRELHLALDYADKAA